MAGEAVCAVTARLGTAEDQVGKTQQYAGADCGALRCENAFNRDVEDFIWHETALTRRDLINEVVEPIFDRSRNDLELLDLGMRWCLVARHGIDAFAQNG
jgi:hypothetical protein